MLRKSTLQIQDGVKMPGDYKNSSMLPGNKTREERYYHNFEENPREYQSIATNLQSASNELEHHNTMYQNNQQSNRPQPMSGASMKNQSTNSATFREEEEEEDDLYDLPDSDYEDVEEEEDNTNHNSSTYEMQNVRQRDALTPTPPKKQIQYYRCEQCQFVSSHKEGLSYHMQENHTKTETQLDFPIFSCTNNGCTYKSSQKLDLEKHITSVHVRTKNYACRECNYKSAQAGNLSRHVRNIHELTNKIKCPECNFQSFKKESVDGHVLTAHRSSSVSASSVTTFKCPYCEYETAKKKGMMDHIKSVH